MKRVSPILKMRVLSAIDYAPGNTIIARIRHVSGQPFTDEDGERFQFTWRTIQTWYSRYQKDGITTMHPRTRSDKGMPRKITPEELQVAVEKVLPTFLEQDPKGTGKRRPKRFNIMAVYRACIEQGALCRDEIAPTTFRRQVKRYELLKPDALVTGKRRLAFCKAHANQLWQADTLIGPYVRNGNGHTQTKLIAFIDDASRVCCHGEFFLSENTQTMIQALRSALYKRGVPEALYVDNGSIYTSKEIHQICVRIGCLLHHAPVRDGAAKGKIERFFRTVRMDFLNCKLDLSSIEALNRQFNIWIEEQYNARVHSTIQMKPIDRYGLDLRRIRYLSPGQVSDELFFVEEDRKVLADNTFSLRKVRYEAPRDVRSRTIQVRCDRTRVTRTQGPERVIVYYKGERLGEAQPVDFIANDRKPPAPRPDPDNGSSDKGDR